MILSIFLDGWAGAGLLALFINVAQCCFMYVALYARQLFGGQSSAAIIGWYTTLSSAVAMFAAPIGTGLASVSHGKYTYLFLLFAICYIFSIVGTLYISSKKTKEQIAKQSQG